MTARARAQVRYDGLCWPKPGQELLLRALADPDPVAARGAYRAWREGTDLESLDAGSQSLMPLLLVRLKELGVDDEFLPRAKGAYRHHFCRGQLQTRAAMPGVDALLSKGIPLVALKGWALLPFYDDDVAQRPMSDVDLLVPRARALEAVDLLLAGGWQLPPWQPRADFERSMRKVHGAGLRKGHAEIDVHWASLLEDNAEHADDELWARAERRSLLGRELLVPDATSLLFHGCVHGSRWSPRSSIVWVPDALRVLARANIDWPRLVRHARDRYLQLPLRETLRFLKERLGAPVPDEVLDALVPPEPAWVFWFDHHATSADPRRSTSAHRAASVIMTKLRRGEPVAGIALDPVKSYVTS